MARLSALILGLAFASATFAQGTVDIGRGGTKPATRKPSPTLASLPAAKAKGPLRILLVDDDRDVGRPSASDAIFRKLVSEAVRGDAKAWSVEVVARDQHGPAFERLRDFNVVLWYTGDLYGGSPSGVSTLSDEDEKTVRRYLREVGGAFILVSPGYLSTRSYSMTWAKSAHPFLNEVVGVNGFSDLVQRFAAGTVRTPAGTSFAVSEKGAVETQFSAVNPDGAAVVFTSALDPQKTAQGAVPVAVAHAYGAGRFVYVGFSIENIAEAERASAFGVLLEAATGTRTALVGRDTDRKMEFKGLPPGPAPIVTVTSYSVALHRLEWTHNPADRPQSFEYYRRDPKGWLDLRDSASAAHVGTDAGGNDKWALTDRAVLPPNSAYKVVAVYPDGRRGETVFNYPNPPQPQPPTQMRVTQIAPGTLRVEWTNAPNTRNYLLHGPDVYAYGAPVMTNGNAGVYDMTLIPDGVHQIRIAADYTDYSNYYSAPKPVISPAIASMTVSVPIKPPASPAGSGMQVAGKKKSAGQSIKPQAAPPPGPPPTGLRVWSPPGFGPHEHLITWEAMNVVATITAYRKERDRFVQVTERTRNDSSYEGFIDRAFVKPGTVYELVASYPDGREGRAEFTYANPRQPEVVTNLRAEQVGTGKLKLTWTRRVPERLEIGYLPRVFAAGLPAGGAGPYDRAGADEEIVFSSVAEGGYSIRVAYMYGGMEGPPARVNAYVTRTEPGLWVPPSALLANAPPAAWVVEGGPAPQGSSGSPPEGKKASSGGKFGSPGKGGKKK